MERMAAADPAALSVAAMSAAAQLSPHHFSRAFRQSFGVSPREWIIRVKLARAKTLLRDTNATVEQIAARLGYRSGSQLARIFRARVGVAPQVFRRR